MTIPNEITELIERFTTHHDSYTQADYKEARVRTEFIDPFFKALGWDVTNEQGTGGELLDAIEAEPSEEVLRHED